VRLSGNQIGALLGYYLLVDDPAPASDRLVITTIVSSPLLGRMAHELGVRYEETLTGFKWIANRALELERETGTRFVFGYEEALGYTVGAVVRDKDGVGAAVRFAELTAYYKSKGRKLLDQVEVIYRRFGLYLSAQHNVTVRGLQGLAELDRLMERFRTDPPARIGDATVTTVSDLLAGHGSLPSSNVIAYQLEGGSRITLRPSGTEPKIKYYFDVCEPFRGREEFSAVRHRAEARKQALIDSFLAEAAARSAR
jgi:phosphomannomutase